MKISTLLRTVVLVAATLAVSAPVRAQDEERSVTVSLVSPQVRPGNDAYVNVMLGNASSSSVRVHELLERIEFPKDKLSFLEAHLGIAGDMAGAELKVEVQDKRAGQSPGADGADADAARFAVISLAVTGKRPIPDGPVVELVFRVPANLEDQVVILGHETVASSAGGAKIPDVVFEKGLVRVFRDARKKPGGGGPEHQM